jgi:hypothetical protein
MSVFTRTPRCQKYFDDRQIIRDVRAGVDAIIAGGERYLPKNPKENQLDYKARLGRSSFTNFTADMVGYLASKPFTRPIVIKSEKHPELAEKWMSAIDGRGTSITGLLASAFADMIWNGTSGICADRSIDGGEPYLYHLSCDNVLGYKMDEDDRLTEIRLLEKAIVADGEWGEKEVERARVFRRSGEVVTWSLYEKDGDKDVVVVADQPFGQKKIPAFFSSAAATLPAGELFAASPVKDVAHMNVHHYQAQSDLSNILHIHSSPILFLKGLGEDTELAIGASAAVHGPADSDLKYVEPTGGATSAGREEVRDLEKKLQSRGSSYLENSGVAVTATGSALRAGETNNKVAMWALNLKAVAEEALASLAYFNKIADPDFVVEIDTEYGVFSDAAEINTLLQACTMGMLSKTDFLLEMQRRGALRSDFSIADNADRLSTEII